MSRNHDRRNGTRQDLSRVSFRSVRAGRIVAAVSIPALLLAACGGSQSHEATVALDSQAEATGAEGGVLANSGDGLADAPGLAETPGAGGSVDPGDNAVANEQVQSQQPGAQRGGPTVRSQAAGPSDPGVTDREIRLGSISMVNSPLGNIVAAPVTTAVQATARSVNDRGGIHGRQLKVIDCDDGGDVSRFRACFRKLVEQDQIFSFITSITFGSGEAHGELERKQIPWVGAWGFYSSEWKDPWMYPAHMSSVNEALLNARWVIARLKPKTVGILRLNTPEQELATQVLKREFAKAGIQVVNEIPQEISTPDESANVLSMRSRNPDHIVHFSWPPPIVKFMVDAAQQGYWPKQGMSGNHFLGEIIGDLVGEWPLQGMWTITSYKTWGEEYLSIMDRYAPQMRQRHHHITQTGYIGARIFAEAAREVGPALTRQGLRKVLESRTWDAGPGLGQEFVWSPNGRSITPCEYMYQYNSTDVGSYKVYVPDPNLFRVCA